MGRHSNNRGMVIETNDFKIGEWFVLNMLTKYETHTDEITGRCRLIFDETHLPTIIDYVHQLQNLYFALTGEELKIKSD